MLGSPHFQTRQAADCSLRSMGEAALPVLTLHVNSRDPEVARRVDILIAATLPARIDRLLARHQVKGGIPWCDSVPRNHALYGELYGMYSCDPRIDVGREEQTEWPRWRSVTRLYFTDCLYSGSMTFAEADALLAAMAARCRYWGKTGWTDLE